MFSSPQFPVYFCVCICISQPTFCFILISLTLRIALGNIDTKWLYFYLYLYLYYICKCFDQLFHTDVLGCTGRDRQWRWTGEGKADWPAQYDTTAVPHLLVFVFVFVSFCVCISSFLYLYLYVITLQAKEDKRGESK